MHLRPVQSAVAALERHRQHSAVHVFINRVVRLHELQVAGRVDQEIRNPVGGVVGERGVADHTRVVEPDLHVLGRGIAAVVRREPGENRAASDAGEPSAQHDVAIHLQADARHKGIRSRRGLIVVAVEEPGINRAIEQQAGVVAPHRVVVHREISADDQLAVGLKRQGIDDAIHSAASLERWVEHAISLQPGHADAHLAVVGAERPADDRPAIGLHLDRKHGIVRARNRRPGRIHHAVGFQAGDHEILQSIDQGERAANEDFAVALHRHRIDHLIRAGLHVERWVEAAVAIQPGDVVPFHVVHRGEISGNDDLAIGLQCHRQHRTGHARAWVERGVERPVHIQPRNALTADVVHRSEATAHQHLAVGQHDQRTHETIRARAGIEGRVHKTAGLDAGHAVAHDGVHRREVTADDRSLRAVLVGRHRIHRAVRARSRVENPQRVIGRVRGAGRQIIVEDVDGVNATRPQGCHHRPDQADEDAFVQFHPRVVDEGDVDELVVHVLIRPGEGAIGAHVIRARPVAIGIGLAVAQVARLELQVVENFVFHAHLTCAPADA